MLSIYDKRPSNENMTHSTTLKLYIKSMMCYKICIGYYNYKTICGRHIYLATVHVCSCQALYKCKMRCPVFHDM